MKTELFNELLESLQQAGAIHQGTMPAARTTTYDTATKTILQASDNTKPEVDVKAIRTKLDLSQRQFALMLGISVDTLQNWEHKRNKPSGPAKALLLVTAKHPAYVLDALKP